MAAIGGSQIENVGFSYLLSSPFTAIIYVLTIYPTLLITFIAPFTALIYLPYYLLEDIATFLHVTCILTFRRIFLRFIVCCYLYPLYVNYTVQFCIAVIIAYISTFQLLMLPFNEIFFEISYLLPFILTFIKYIAC